MCILPALAVALIPLVPSGAPERESPRSVFDLRGSACRSGALEQPGGPFLAYVFCDGALGTQIGVVLAGLTDLAEPWSGWRPDQRFWQEEPWATDVTSIAWDPFGNTLFVATSEVYGDGGVFALDLANRKHERVYSIQDVDPGVLQEAAERLEAESHLGFIEGVSPGGREITVSIRLAHGDGESTIIGKRTLMLGKPSPAEPAP